MAGYTWSQNDIPAMQQWAQGKSASDIASGAAQLGLTADQINQVLQPMGYAGGVSGITSAAPSLGYAFNDAGQAIAAPAAAATPKPPVTPAVTASVTPAGQTGTAAGTGQPISTTTGAGVGTVTQNDLVSQLKNLPGVVQANDMVGYIKSLPDYQASVQGLDYSKLPGVSTDFSGDAKQAQDAVYKSAMSLLQPGFDTQNRQIDQQLADQGIPVGSEAWTRAKDQLSRAQGSQMSNLALQAVGAGNDLQNTRFGQSLASNQNAAQQQQDLFNSGMMNASLANSTRQNEFGSLMNLSNFQNQTRNSEIANLLNAGTFSNNAQNQIFNQGLLDRQLSLQGELGRGQLSNQAASVGVQGQQAANSLELGRGQLDLANLQTLLNATNMGFLQPLPGGSVQGISPSAAITPPSGAWNALGAIGAAAIPKLLG